MARFLLLYATRYGHSASVAKRLQRVLEETGQDAESHDLSSLPEKFRLAEHEVLILGGAVHMGKYPRVLRRFIHDHRAQIERHPNAFFSICNAIHSQRPQDVALADRYLQTLVRETGWIPQHVAHFAGAIAYTRYNPVIRFVMKQIASKTGASTDTSRDHVYTDWDAVDGFARRLAEEMFPAPD